MLRTRLSRLAWHARVRVGRTAPPVLAILLALWAARAFFGPGPVRRPARASFSTGEEPWREWRERLYGANRDRWAGRTESALGTYGRVARALSARPADRYRARYWHARLRLEAGEWSAVLDLDALVGASDDPALVVRCALLVLRFEERDETGAHVHDLRRVVRDARAKLQSFALQSGPEGARARVFFAMNAPVSLGFRRRNTYHVS
ncbi:MAG: hypothetical protein AAGB93_07205 [Planctomycetota bacterium]